MVGIDAVRKERKEFFSQGSSSLKMIVLLFFFFFCISVTSHSAVDPVRLKKNN